MKNLFYILFVIIIASCNKDNKDSLPPSLYLKTGSEYVSSDTTLKIGDKFRFGITAVGKANNLTNFIIKLNNVAYLDTGFNSPGLNFDILITKGIDSIDNWELIIRDRQGNSSSLKIKILKDINSSFGDISHYSPVELGAQSNTSFGSFYSLSNNMVYSQNDAFSNQQLIDLLYYYFYDAANPDKNTVASPAANFSTPVFTGTSALSNWSTLNTTRFIKLSITAEQYDDAANDSLLLASYKEIDGKRKAKNLAEGDIYSFKTHSSRYGIFKVLSVSGTDNGTVSLDIKIQK